MYISYRSSRGHGVAVDEPLLEIGGGGHGLGAQLQVVGGKAGGGAGGKEAAQQQRKTKHVFLQSGLVGYCGMTRL